MMRPAFLAAQALPVIEADEFARSDWLAFGSSREKQMYKYKGQCPPGVFWIQFFVMHLLEPARGHFVQLLCVHQAWMWHDSQTGASRQSVVLCPILGQLFSGYTCACCVLC